MKRGQNYKRGVPVPGAIRGFVVCQTKDAGGVLPWQNWIEIAAFTHHSEAKKLLESIEPRQQYRHRIIPKWFIELNGNLYPVNATPLSVPLQGYNVRRRLDKTEEHRVT